MSRFFNLFTVSFLIFAISIYSITYVAVHEISSPILSNFDIVSFYTGGLIVDRGERANLYNRDTQYTWQATVSHLGKSSLKPFINPPFVALFFAPFTRISFRQTYIIFAFLNTTLFLITIYFFMKEQFVILKDNRYIFFLLWILFYMPIYANLLQGQLAFFLFSGLMISWYAFKCQKSLQAGIALSLFLIKPYLLCIPVFLLIWKKQWRALLGLFLSASGLVILSVWLIGLHTIIMYLQFISTSLFNTDNYRMFPQTEPTFRGFLQYLSHSDSLSMIIIPFFIAIVMFCFILFAVWKGQWNGKNKKFDIQWAVLIVVILLTSIHSYYYDLVLLLIPYSILLKSIRSNLLLYCSGIGIDFVMFIFFLLGPWQSFFALFLILLLGILAILSSRWYHTEAFVLG